MAILRLLILRVTLIILDPLYVFVPSPSHKWICLTVNLFFQKERDTFKKLRENDKSFLVAKMIIGKDVDGFKKNGGTEDDWKKLKYFVTLKIDDMTMNLTLSFFHFVVLFDRQQILEHVIKMDLEGDDANKNWDNWIHPVSYRVANLDDLDGLDSYDKWICDANCIHLASKFNPKALQIMLTQLPRSKSDKKEFIRNVVDKKGIVSPLHVAAGKLDSLSTR